ncbi:hypothetical protein [Streptomyces zaomyceticus]|uniref:hypothetical protein n=1 Tax=Streptomyces zaomyceticus TaxID=68286 RepID=UPI002E241C84
MSKSIDVATLDVPTAREASGLKLGDLVEYDGRVIDAPEAPQFVPGGRGRLRDVWQFGDEILARVEREDGEHDNPSLANVRPATTTVRKLSSELQAGDVVHEYGMRVRLDELVCPPYSGHGGALVYSWRGTVLNLADVHAESYVPRSFLRQWEGLRLLRGDVWTVQGNANALRDVEVPEDVAPETPAPRTVTVRTEFIGRSIPTRLRAAGAPGDSAMSAAGLLVWRLPDGEELTPGEAAKRFLSGA